MADLARRDQEFFQNNFAPRLMAQMDDQIALGRRQVDLQEEGQRFQLGLMRRYDDRYWGTQVPLEDELIAKARAWNDPAEQERMAGQAGADVSQAFSNANEALQRGLSRRGINPGSAASIAAMRSAANEEALGMAGAINATREAARQMGWTRLGEAAALGRGLPGFGATSANLATGMGDAALRAGSAGMGAVTTAAGAFNHNTNTIGNLWNNVGNLGVNSYNSQLNAYRTAMDNNPLNAILGAAAGVGMGWALRRI
jgi:hypothetical protein